MQCRQVLRGARSRSPHIVQHSTSIAIVVSSVCGVVYSNRCKLKARGGVSDSCRVFEPLVVTASDRYEDSVSFFAAANATTTQTTAMFDQ